MEPEFDFNSVSSKIWADSVSMRVINGLLHVAFTSGKTATTFLLPLPLAKQISRGMGKLVEEIEQKTGQVFDDRLPNEPTPSPWSSSGNENNSGKK